MKRCELCTNPARIHCEADGASLCCNCDEKVHSANFLVAKHTRNLLCHVCQSQTPWRASGAKLGPALSVCSTCVENSGAGGKQGRRGSESEEETDGRRDGDETGADECSVCDESYEELSESGEDEDEEIEEGGGDYQVVPWSGSTTPSPPASSCETVSFRRGGGEVSGLKRMREDDDLDSEQDESGCTSSRFKQDENRQNGHIPARFEHNVALMAPSSPALDTDGKKLLLSVRPVNFKRHEANGPGRVDKRNEAGPESVAMVVNSLRNFQQYTISIDNSTSGVELGTYRPSKDRAVV